MVNTWAKVWYFRFYRAMLRKAQLCYSLSVCPSVYPSVTFRYCDHIVWNTSKIISRPTSLRYLLTLFPAWSIWSNGTPPKLGWYKVGVMSANTRNISETPKRCKIVPRLLWRTNRKSHTRFRLVPKSMTLDGPERPKRTCRKIVLQSPPEKFEWR